MKDNFKNRCIKFYRDHLTDVMYYAFVAFILLITIWIFVNSPMQKHFKEAANNDVWFGEGWNYVNENGSVNADDSIVTRNEHYMRLKAHEDMVTITKVMDCNTYSQDYLCFRVRAQEVYIYVNGISPVSLLHTKAYHSHRYIPPVLSRGSINSPGYKYYNP